MILPRLTLSNISMVKWSNPCVVAIVKGAFWSPSTTFPNFTWLYLFSLFNSTSTFVSHLKPKSSYIRFVYRDTTTVEHAVRLKSNAIVRIFLTALHILSMAHTSSGLFKGIITFEGYFVRKPSLKNPEDSGHVAFPCDISSKVNVTARMSSNSLITV